MRIIGGRFGGRRLNPPLSKWPTRPTTDIAREGLFNMLYHSMDFEQLKVLDLFGGTGAISFEFCSRGSTDVTYVDSFYPCIRFVKQQAKDFELDNDLKIIKSDVFKFLDRADKPFDLIFCDPPYSLKALSTLPDLIFSKHLLNDQGLLIIEHGMGNNFEDHERFWKSRKYGDSVFSFFL